MFLHVCTPVVMFLLLIISHGLFKHIFSDLEEYGFKIVDDIKFSSYKMLKQQENITKTRPNETHERVEKVKFPMRVSRVAYLAGMRII